MPRKRHKPEEIVAKLRQVDVLTSQGRSVADAIRSIGVTEVTYYRWRQEFGGLKSDQVRRLKDLETENSRLCRAVCRLRAAHYEVVANPRCMGRSQQVGRQKKIPGECDDPRGADSPELALMTR